MIQEIRNLQPFIDFGFGITEKTANTGETVTVWLSTLYNESAYVTSLNANGAAINRISPFEYEVAYNAPGTYDISLNVGSNTRKISMQSNILTLIVI